jgi:hypothetical protein
MESRSCAVPVFVSVGQRYAREQERLLEGLYSTLESLLLLPQVLPRDQSYLENPLEAIQRVMADCHGALIVAFPRISYTAGFEWPGSPQQVALGGRSLPTVWNQIEAAIACQLDLPILALVDDRLHAEGLLSPKHEAYNAHFFNMERSQHGLESPMGAVLQRFAVSAIRHANIRR